MDSYLTNNKFLAGEDFTIADMYALAILRLASHVGIKLEKFAALSRYMEMLEKIPSVKRASEMESHVGAKKTA